ncbi:hypothetical protein BGZ49_005517 [Haplosporangium sp. Z 27]|nr:hypothetical protein BGZ49_005517 [Haplosporangium sp. Z 27]
MNPARPSTSSISSQKLCGSNGNPGCVRGFVRNRCQKCDLGSIVCEMCLPPPPSPPPSSPSSLSSPSTLFFKQSSTLNQSQTKNKKKHRVSYTASSQASNAVSSSVAFMPRRSLSLGPNPTSSSIVNKSRQSLSFSHPHGLSPVSSPTSPTFSDSLPPSPTSSSSPFNQPISDCIYCRSGRKPCEDCFGLGYVQQVCKVCIRESHRRHNSSSGIGVISSLGNLGNSNNGARRKSSLSLPSTWNQMGGGWSKFKEQLLLGTGTKSSPHAVDVVVHSVITQGSQQIEGSLQPQQQQQQQQQQQEQQEQQSDQKKEDFGKPPFDGEDIQVITATSQSTPQSPISTAHVRDSSKSDGRISFRATIMKRLKVPLFSNNISASKNNDNSNNSGDQTRRGKLHLRQWSISLFTPTLLRAASTAA